MSESRSRRSVLPAVVGLSVVGYLGAPALASPNPARAETGPAAQAPPWLVTARQFMMVVVQAEAKAVQALLPRGVEVNADGQGMANLTLEVYAAERASGIPKYETAFIVADIKGWPSRDGTAGHFALWGLVRDQDALARFRRVYGFPYGPAERIALDVQDGRHRAMVQVAAGAALQVEIEPLPDQAFEREGTVNMVGGDPGLGLAIGEVPYLSRGHVGKVVRLDVNAGTDRALALLKAARPVWSMVSTDQTFAYANRRGATPAPE